MAESLPLILVLPVLLVLSAIASGSETALFRLSHRERAELRRSVPGVSAAVESLLAEPRQLLLFVLLMNMVVNVAYFVVSSVLTTRAGSPALAAAIGAGSVLTIVLFGEILAKAVAGTGRRRFCLVFARPLAVAQLLLSPVVTAVDRFALSPMIRLLRPGGAGPARLVETGGASGVLSDNEQRLLAEVIELGEIRVHEAMQPRDRIVALPQDAGPDEILTEAARTRRTAILICTPTLERGVAGFLHVKRYLAAAHGRGRAPPLRPFLERALFVPERARLDAVLEIMRRRATTHALCVDEHGRVVGLIDADDIVNELLAGIGESRSAEGDAVHLVGLGRWSVPGDLALRDWMQYFGIVEREAAEELQRVSTIGGLVVRRLGRIAAPGDRIEIGPARVTVEQMHGRRVRTLTVELDHEGPAPEVPTDDGAAGGAP